MLFCVKLIPFSTVSNEFTMENLTCRYPTCPWQMAPHRLLYIGYVRLISLTICESLNRFEGSLPQKQNAF